MTEHVVTAIEPQWVGELYRPSTESGHEPDSPDEVYPEYAGLADFDSQCIDMLMDQAEYECSCGEDLDGWDAVGQHFIEVASDD